MYLIVTRKKLVVKVVKVVVPMKVLALAKVLVK
jgi:hypothetical protein